MNDRQPGYGEGHDDEELRSRDEFSGEGAFASSERDQTRSRERVHQRALDEAGEIPAADADVEAGESRRAEQYED